MDLFGASKRDWCHSKRERPIPSSENKMAVDDNNDADKSEATNFMWVISIGTYVKPSDIITAATWNKPILRNTAPVAYVSVSN